MDYYSPAQSATSDLTDEELDEYFATYVPLSNLPTPPIPKEESKADQAFPLASTVYEAKTIDRSHYAPEYQAYAAHLANLVPLNVSSRRPRPAVIQGFLKQASLPDEIIAFSACILDALSSRFAATWRASLIPPSCAKEAKQFVAANASHSFQVSPDVIVLAALALAHGFLIDRLRSARHWAEKESGGELTMQEIESTQRAILQDMDYRLFRISEKGVQRRLRALQSAATTPIAASPAVMPDPPHGMSKHLTGAGVWSLGVQTPEPSP